MTLLSIAAGSIPRVSGSAYFFDDWRVVAFQATGRQHVQDHLPCQDALLYGEVGPILWFAMADGVGSESLSQPGAELLVEAVGEFVAGQSPKLTGLSRDDPGAVAGLIVDHCRARLETAASNWGREVREFSSTLQVVILHRELEQLMYFAVGDGHCLIRTDEAVTVLGINRTSPDFGAATLSLADHKAYLHCEVVALSKVQSLLLFTDGLDRFFILPRVREAQAAAPAENVAKVSNILRDAVTEADAVSKFGRIVTDPGLDHLLRDDRSLLALCRCEPVIVAAPKPLLEISETPGDVSKPEHPPLTSPPPEAPGPDNAKAEVSIQATNANQARKVRHLLILALAIVLAFLVVEFGPDLFAALKSMFGHDKPAIGVPAEKRGLASPSQPGATPREESGPRAPIASAATPEPGAGRSTAPVAAPSPRKSVNTLRPPRRQPMPTPGTSSPRSATPSPTGKPPVQATSPVSPAPATRPSPANGAPPPPDAPGGNTTGAGASSTRSK